MTNANDEDGERTLGNRNAVGTSNEEANKRKNDGSIIAASDREQLKSRSTNKSVIFHISLMYNLVLHHERRRPWWNRIDTYILLGALPFRDKHHLERLIQDEHVQAVITMNQPSELLSNLFGIPISPLDWAHANVPQCFGATTDFAPPTLDTIQKCVDFLHAQVQHQKTTYVHCKAGRGRSTVVVAAYLIQHRQMTVNEAYKSIQTHRPHVNLHPKQLAILHGFQASIASTISNKQ